jgi:hypothetical protein
MGARRTLKFQPEGGRTGWSKWRRCRDCARPTALSFGVSIEIDNLDVKVLWCFSHSMYP